MVSYFYESFQICVISPACVLYSVDGSLTLFLPALHICLCKKWNPLKLSRGRARERESERVMTLWYLWGLRFITVNSQKVGSVSSLGFSYLGYWAYIKTLWETVHIINMFFQEKEQNKGYVLPTTQNKYYSVLTEAMPVTFFPRI